MTWFDARSDEERATLTRLLEDPRGRHIKALAGDDVAFGCWLLKAEALCRRDTGFGLADFPDVPFRDFYRDELTPEELVEAVRSAE